MVLYCSKVRSNNKKIVIRQMMRFPFYIIIGKFSTDLYPFFVVTYEIYVLGLIREVADMVILFLEMVIDYIFKFLPKISQSYFDCLIDGIYDVRFLESLWAILRHGNIYKKNRLKMINNVIEKAFIYSNTKAFKFVVVFADIDGFGI